MQHVSGTSFLAETKESPICEQANDHLLLLEDDAGRSLKSIDKLNESSLPDTS